MILKIADKFARYLFFKELIDEVDIEVYSMGNALLISTIINNVISIFIGWMSGLLIETIIFFWYMVI